MVIICSRLILKLVQLKKKMIKWLPNDQMITKWSNDYQMIKWLPNDYQMITKWSNDYQMIKWLPNDQMISKWSNDYQMIKWLQIIKLWANGQIMVKLWANHRSATNCHLLSSVYPVVAVTKCLFGKRCCMNKYMP